MHSSIREFTGDPVSEVDVEQAIAAAQSAATSSHLQSWSVIKITDKFRKREVNRLCGHQGQIEIAPLTPFPLGYVAEKAKRGTKQKRSRQSRFNRHHPRVPNSRSIPDMRCWRIRSFA